MWERKELKTKAKGLLKVNYWKSVLVGIIMTFLAGGTAAATSASSTDENSIQTILDTITDADMLALFAIILGVSAVVLVFSLLLQILFYNPLEVGCQKFFVECDEEGTTPLGHLFYAFKNGYGRVVLAMLCRNLFIFLWSLLLVIPGVIKTYEYRMVPYILADDPSISRKEAFAKSKEMMMGNKWQAFVLDLSFIPWNLLSGITLGILAIFYVAPYTYLTSAQLYHALKEQ